MIFTVFGRNGHNPGISHNGHIGQNAHLGSRLSGRFGQNSCFYAKNTVFEQKAAKKQSKTCTTARLGCRKSQNWSFLVFLLVPVVDACGSEWLLSGSVIGLAPKGLSPMATTCTPWCPSVSFLNYAAGPLPRGVRQHNLVIKIQDVLPATTSYGGQHKSVYIYKMMPNPGQRGCWVWHHFV